MTKAVNNITRALKSRYPLIYVQGWDEERIEGLLSSIGKSSFQQPKPLYVWTQSQGFSHLDDTALHEPLAALLHIQEAPGPALYLLKDMPMLLESQPALVRALRDLYYRLRNRGSFVFLSCPMLKLPETLKKEIFVADMPLPMEDEILTVLRQQVSNLPAARNLEEAVLYQAAQAMKGLSLNEVGHVAARIFAGENLKAERLLTEIFEEKQQILRKESCLRFYPSLGSLDEIGGLGNLKQWVEKRRELFTERAFKSGVPLPSGVLFMGVSGCGKSLAAKTIAAAWGVPLVRLDMSLVMSGAFGPPEMVFDQATRTAEEIAPVVLWVDELENSLGYDELNNAAGGNANIFSSFLTWMQEKPANVFLAATANRIKQIPAELMRKGRFDQLFFLDLPDKDERAQIFNIHIRKQGGLPSNFDIGYLSAATKGWSGAEIEQAVKSARVDAFQEGRSFVEQDVLRNTANMVPLSRTMEEQIQAIKDWSFNRATPASGDPDQFVR